MASTDSLLPSGMPGLDLLLNGGLSQPGLTAIIGTPGAGKTVLASQIIFNAAQRGLKTIIFTAYSESSEQLIRYLRPFPFFDESLLGTMILLFPLNGQVSKGDTNLASAIVHTIRSANAKVVLFDALQGVTALLPDQQSLRAFLSALALQSRYLDTAILITLAGSARDPQLHAELTIADCAIGLEYRINRRRHQRLVEVVKLRGRAQLPGVHSYRISDQGVEVFPRVETYSIEQHHTPPKERLPFGLPELDRLLDGGPNAGTVTLLAGAPGVGKTTLGMKWVLMNATPEAPSVFLMFAEHEEQLLQKAAAFDLELEAAVATGAVRIVRLSSVDVNPDEVTAILIKELAAGTVRRLVIDDIAVLIHELGERTHDYIAALNDVLYRHNVTTMYQLEIAPFEGLRLNLVNTPLAMFGDNVIVVQQYDINGSLRRLLAVLRMRLSFYERSIRELVFDTTGIAVLRPDQSSSGVLEVGAQMSGGTAPTSADPIVPA